MLLRSRRAFTLIELLVVIAIIAVLDRTAVAGRAAGTRSRPSLPVPEQPQADRAGVAQLSQRFKIFPPGQIAALTRFAATDFSPSVHASWQLRKSDRGHDPQFFWDWRQVPWGHKVATRECRGPVGCSKSSPSSIKLSFISNGITRSM